MSQPTTILCLSSYLKGHDFLREAKRLGCRVLLLTKESLRDADWPRDHIDEVFLMPGLQKREDVMNGVSYLARTERIDRIVSLDEFDLEMAAALREHLRIPGMGETTVRYFRDKLAMRMRAVEVGIPVPDFVSLIHHDGVRAFLSRVPPPWILKPRHSASAIGLRKLDDPDEVWRVVDGLGDEQSHHLLERFVEGGVYHVDSIVWEKQIVFADEHDYVAPPFKVYHGGGMFGTRTLTRGTPEERALEELNARVAEALGMVRGVLHTEFIRGHADGRFYFLETAARVGGAHIVETIEAATGLNLWREWARLEVAHARGEAYQVPPYRHDYAGLVLCLARQEWPDTSAYTDPEIVWRMTKRHHVGLIVASPRRDRVQELIDAYLQRFGQDFVATLPPPARAADAVE